MTTERVRSSGMRKMPSLRQNGSPRVSISHFQRSASDWGEGEQPSIAQRSSRLRGKPAPPPGCLGVGSRRGDVVSVDSTKILGNQHKRRPDPKGRRLSRRSLEPRTSSMQGCGAAPGSGTARVGDRADDPAVPRPSVRSCSVESGQVVAGVRGVVVPGMLGPAGTGGGGGAVMGSVGAGRGGTGVAASPEGAAGAVVVAPCIELPPHCFVGAAMVWPDTTDFDGALSV